MGRKIISLACVCTIAGCAHIDDLFCDKGQLSGRQAWVDTHPNERADFKEAILEGRILCGMMPEHVIASWGHPSKVKRVVNTLGIHEEWTYWDSRYVYFKNRRLEATQRPFLRNPVYFVDTVGGAKH